MKRGGTQIEHCKQKHGPKVWERRYGMGHTDFNMSLAFLGEPMRNAVNQSMDWILLEVPTPKVNLSNEAKSRTEFHG